MAYFDRDRRIAGTMTPSSGSVYDPGEKNAGEYIVSGIPFVSSSTFNATTTYEMEFPYLSQWIIVQNLDGSATVDIGFTSDGVGGNHKYTLAGGETSPKFEIRSKSVFVKGTNAKNYQVIAGLTNIQTGSIADYENIAYWGV